jgi:hypothetical protein
VLLATRHVINIKQKIKKNICEKLSYTVIAERYIKFLSDGMMTDDYANNFSSYIIHLVREWVACTFKSLKDIDNDYKTELWDEIKIKQ